MEIIDFILEVSNLLDMTSRDKSEPPLVERRVQRDLMM